MNRTEELKKPDLKEYLSLHHYLSDLYSFRKKTEWGFSYETWAQELGLANRSYLRQLVIGRRGITSATADQICHRLNFDQQEREYFHLLLLYSKATSTEQKNLYGRKLRQLIKSDYTQTEIQTSREFLSKPLNARLLTLLSFQDIEKTLDSLSKILECPPQEVENSLNLLETMGLANRTPTTPVLWNSNQRAFKVPDQIGSESLLKFHTESLHEAIQAQTKPPEDRKYRSLFLPLSQENLQEFQEDLQEFIKQCLKKFDQPELRGRKLFQLNLNFHSVSQSVEEQKES